MSNDPHPKLTALRAQLDQGIEHFDSESTKHKRLFRKLRYGVFIFTTLATILAGMSAANLCGEWVKIILVAATASVSLLASIEGLRKPAELWLNERSICHGLRDLKRKVDYYAVEKFGSEDLDKCFEQMQVLLSDGSNRWRQELKPSNGKAG